jgi:hypothetical protein
VEEDSIDAHRPVGIAREADPAPVRRAGRGGGRRMQALLDRMDEGQLLAAPLDLPGGEAGEQQGGGTEQGGQQHPPSCRPAAIRHRARARFRLGSASSGAAKAAW